MNFKPIHTAADADALLGQRESGVLEFKREPWHDAEECAKDVGGLANADGGQIVLGVDSDDDSTAIGFRAWPGALSPDKAEQRIYQLLEHTLRPRDFVDPVARRSRRVATTGGVGLFVIDVPASAALVGVACAGPQRKAGRFVFPIRVERETRAMEYDEIVRRVGDPGRALRLRFQEKLEVAQRRASPLFAQILSPVASYNGANEVGLHRLSSSPYDGSIAEAVEEGVIFVMDSTYRPANDTSAAHVSGIAILIPYPLIRAAWSHPVRPTMCLVIDGRIVIDPGHSLRLAVG